MKIINLDQQKNYTFICINWIQKVVTQDINLNSTIEISNTNCTSNYIQKF